MRLLALTVLFGCLVGLVLPAPTSANELNMYAIDSSGQSVSADGYAWNIVVYTAEQRENMNSSDKARHNLFVALCGVTYYMTEYHKKWLEAHGKYKHDIILRERQADGSLVTICQ